MPAARKPRASKPKSNGTADESTPARVVDAAIACILEEGFYRASSNEIARRAEVTWGVIQYHFGTREALLLAVLQRAAAELQGYLNTPIQGDTLAERVNQLGDIVWGYYGRPEFLAYMQVMLNLSHDPTTEGQTLAAMNDNQIHVGQSLPKLLRDVIGDAVPDDHPDSTRLGTYLFAALRGMAIDQGHVAALPTSRANPGTHAEERAMLQASLVAYVESVAGKTADKGRRLLTRR